MLLFVISLIIGFLVKWQIAKYLVNALTSLFAFFVILLITNTIGAFVVNSLGVFDITGLIIGTIIGGIFGVISEALRFDD